MPRSEWILPLPTLAVISLLMTISLPLLDGTPAGDGSNPVFTIDLISLPSSSPEGLQIEVQGLSIHGEIGLGFSTGDEFEIVIDPTPGAPNIPWIATMVLVDGDILDIGLVGREKARVPHSTPIMTVPRATTPWEAEETWGTWDGYGRYPDQQVRFESLGYKRVEGALLHSYSLWFTPYSLEGSHLYHAGDTEVEVQYTEDMAGPSPTRITGDPGSVLGTLSITSNIEVHPQYLIITGEETADELAVLAQWRNGMGIATSVITVEDIYEQYVGSDDPADLVRDYIIDVVDTWGTLEHVMLAGDWDTVPTKRVVDSEAYAGWDDGYIPADTYFQCLDGTWDLDGDGLYSEPGDMEDIIPDISVSRLAINDPVIWHDKIEQITAYESDRSSSQWTSKALLIAANTHNYGDGSTHSEYIWDKYLNDTYPVKLSMYEDENTLTLADVDEALTSGVTFVQFVDHGGPTVWCDDYGAGVVYRDRDARELTNSNMMPVVSTLACLTNWFDDTAGCQYQRFSEGLGEVFTENTQGGALGYIGSSRTSVGILGANRYLPYDNGLQEDIARQIGGMEEFTLGSAFTEGKKHYAEVWGQQFPGGNREVAMCWLEFTLLGEPVVEMWTGRYGDMQLEVHHEDDLDPHIQIKIMDGEGAPLPEANVTLQNFDRGVFSRGSTDQDGIVTFDLELDWFCDINLTVTKHNFHQVRDYIRISDTIPPITSILTDPSEPDGKNGWFLSEPGISLIPNENAVVHYRLGTSDLGQLNRSNNFTLPALGEGVHALHFFSEDDAGNIENEIHAELKIDLGSPNITLSISPEEPDGENGWYGTEPLVSVELQEDDRGSPVTIHYTLDGEEHEYEGPFFVPEGIHSIRITGTDLSGRMSDPILLELKVDTTPPSTISKLSIDVPDGQNGWYVTSPLVELRSSEEEAYLEYRYSTREKFVVYTGPFHVEDGNHLLQYRSVDRSGNIGVTESIPLKVDTRPPTMTCTVIPVEPDGLEGFFVTTPTIRINWYDNVGSTLFLSMDGGIWSEDITRFDVPDGVHEIMIYAEDEAGNSCPVQSIDVKVDTQVPKTRLVAEDPGPMGWYDNTPLIELLSEPDAEIVYWWEGKGEVNTYQRPLDTPSREGTFRLHFYSRDRAGNEEYETVETFKVDTKDPILRFDTLHQGKGRFLIDLSRTTDGTRVSFRLLEGDTTLVDWTQDSNIELDLGPGDHRITVETRDEAGNTVSTDMDLKVEPVWIPLIKYGVIPLLIIAVSVSLIVILVRRKRKGGTSFNNIEDRRNTQVLEAVEL